MELNPYMGACSAVDEVCRNLIAVGSTPDSILDCLNFGNPEKPERMGEFYEACRGLGFIAKELRLPFISGNVSFYNESPRSAVPPTPGLVGVGIVSDIRKCITTDFKKENNPLYLVGKQTEKELGGSEYYKIMNCKGGFVPRVDIKILKNCMKSLLKVIGKKYINSCHDVSEGGIGVCLSEMIIGGDIGAIVDISNINNNLRDDFTLFSETNTRWIVEVKKQYKNDFEKILKLENTKFIKIGLTKGNQLAISNEKKPLINLEIDDIRTIWKNAILNIMG
jgi:phosphoribosylformylglycinamidine synthase